MVGNRVGKEVKKIAISEFMFMKTLDKLVKSITDHPHKVEYYKEQCIDQIKAQTKLLVRDAIATMVTNLYQGQMNALKVDLARVSFAGSKDASPEERSELLRCLMGSLNFYFMSDFSMLVNLCQDELDRRIREEEGIEDVEELPFH